MFGPAAKMAIFLRIKTAIFVAAASEYWGIYSRIYFALRGMDYMYHQANKL